MPYTRKTCTKEQKALRRPADKTLDNVISLRISDQEKRVLERLTKRSSKNISEVMRDALNHWISNRGRLCLD